LIDKEQANELRQNLKDTSSPIWHGLISFEEVFGKEYCGTYEQAHELMKTQLPKFLKNARFNPNNIEWFAGLHTNTEHRHIHFSFYEKEPQKRRYKKEGLYFSKGKVNQFSINRLKADFELKMISDKIILKERDMLIKNAKNILGGGIGKELYRDIQSLIEVLPKEGRLSYWSDNIEPFRQDINYVAKKLIRGNAELNNNYKQVMNKAFEIDVQIMKVFDYDEDRYKYHMKYDKLTKDINARLGNLLLKFIKDHNFVERQKEYRYKNRLVEKRIRKNKTKYLINKMNYLNAKFDREAMQAFEEFHNKLRQYEYENLLNKRESQRDDFEM
jgi:hypothetical protein